MASLVLGAVGTAIGGMIGGTATILGMTAGTIGGMVGSAIGSVVDSMIIASMQPGQRVEGARLDSLRVTSATEGVVIPRMYGRLRTGGNIIWATDFRERIIKSRQDGGGKGSGGGVTTKEYLYYASFAVGICEGPITGIGRIWADGMPLKMDDVTLRWYPGDEDQLADPFIVAKMGADNTPAYRGTAYVVFEELLLERFGNRIPQLSFEVFRPLADDDTAEGMVQAVAMGPGTGEFAYATTPYKTTSDGTTATQNVNSIPPETDFTVALDRLQAQAPAVASVSLVVAWFGDDLRAGECLIKPGVETASKTTEPWGWSVDGVPRASAHLVSTVDGSPAFGGTPSDRSIVEALREIKARGLRVTFYPFLLMDIPAGNTKPDPYSDNAAVSGQAVYPWRGRITCSPAAGYVGTVDKTSDATTQVAAFFGDAQPDDFDVINADGDIGVIYDGATDWGYRRMILHYAHLCAAVAAEDEFLIDAFLIGSELRGLTQVRNELGFYRAVAELKDLADECRSILGGDTKISYAADWSEYFGHQPDDGTGDVIFNLDYLWSADNIDFIGIDNYWPLADWRDGHEHLDAVAGAGSIYDHAYLQGNIEGGEGYDWYYASDADRASQTRTPITDGAYAKPWVFRYKDIRAWWSNEHHNRPGGVENVSATAWVPESKPIWFTELGCPAVDRAANQPNVFYDPKSDESGLPYFSRGWRDDAGQRAWLEAMLGYWADTANNPMSGEYAGRMIRNPEAAAWTWDTRPYPFFPELTDTWSEGDNWRLGHWLTGRLGAVSLRALVRELCRAAGLDDDHIDVSGLHGAIEGMAITAIEAPRTSLAVLARHFAFDAVESEGRIKFTMRGLSAPAAVLTVDDLVAGSGAAAEPLELTRAQESELPQALKWSLGESNGEYDAAMVEARRITVTASRVTAESFPMVVPVEEAERRCRRALMEVWAGRERVAFQLPPSRLALDPADVVQINHAGRTFDARVTGTAEREARSIEAQLHDREVYDLPPGASREVRRVAATVFGPPLVQILEVPQFAGDAVQHQPLVAAYANPWPGEVAIFGSTGADDFELATTMQTPDIFGTLVDPLPAGPVSRWDLGNTVLVDVLAGTLESVTDRAMFGGANAFAIETAPDVWEVFQAATCELVLPGRYRLSRLLRGQLGTEGAMGDPTAAGARVILLNNGPVRIPINSAELGLPWNWRVGPATLPHTDAAYTEQAFTPVGVGLRPWSVCHVYAGAETLPGKITFYWTRRSRARVADNWGAVEVPLAEESEAYEVDIMDGATVKRTLSVLVPEANYTTSQQTADWGAALDVGDTLTVRIAQISALVGRGAVREFTLEL